VSRLFEAGSLDGLAQNVLQQRSNELKSKYDQKRNFYHQYKNTYKEYSSWLEVTDRLTEFDNTKWNPWNQQWGNTLRTNNYQAISQYFERAEVFFQEMDEYLDNHKPEPQHSIDVESLKAEMLRNIETDFLSLKSEMSSSINAGINNVLDLKAELGLEKNFQEKIVSELGTSRNWRNFYVFVFVLSLLLGPFLLLVTFFSNQFDALATTEKWVLRAAVTLTFFALTLFFFSQYKLYQLMSIKYSQMNAFLGGGASFITQMLDSENQTTKTQVNQKIANLFMELDDVYGLVRKDSHPVEASADRVERIVKEALAVGKNEQG